MMLKMIKAMPNLCISDSLYVLSRARASIDFVCTLCFDMDIPDGLTVLT